MGITGLLPVLEPAVRKTHLSAFQGQTVGVDGHVWLHRGAYACAAELARGEPTSRFLNYARRRLALLQNLGVTPYVVLDGAPLPVKRGTNASRAERRAENLARAHALEAQGDAAAADKHFKACIRVTPTMVRALVAMLRAAGVAYLVAPYEADAQLAYLERSGLVDAILTEDSDLLVFGSRRVLMRLEDDGGCQLLERRAVRSAVAEPYDLRRWPLQRFVDWCVLSGCDYLSSARGVGLAKAHKYISSVCSRDQWDWDRGIYHDLERSAGEPYVYHDDSDPEDDHGHAPAASSASPGYRSDTLSRCIKSMVFKSQSIPDGYTKDALRARLTFRHQRVFCPRTRELVLLRPWPDLAHPARLHANSDYVELGLADTHPDHIRFLGPWCAPEIARAIAAGDLDPVTLRPYPDVEPSATPDLATLELASSLSAAQEEEEEPVSSPPSAPPRLLRPPSNAPRSSFNPQPRSARAPAWRVPATAGPAQQQTSRFFTPAPPSAPAPALPPIVSPVMDVFPASDPDVFDVGSDPIYDEDYYSDDGEAYSDEIAVFTEFEDEVAPAVGEEERAAATLPTPALSPPPLPPAVIPPKPAPVSPPRPRPATAAAAVVVNVDSPSPPPAAAVPPPAAAPVVAAPRNPFRWSPARPASKPAASAAQNEAPPQPPAMPRPRTRGTLGTGGSLRIGLSGAAQGKREGSAYFAPPLSSSQGPAPLKPVKRARVG
ncbi:hypothetical protein H9P43_007839 [Blastocladiella emersonii ATCC 22665]|nr:hypothetical protein H9P43_007839 [Blastocladiella emersonii ATCC 22665]